MVSFALKISDEFRAIIDKLPWVNWSELAREESFDNIKTIEVLHKLNELFKNSKLTDEDILNLSKKVRKGRFKELKSKRLI